MGVTQRPTQAERMVDAARGLLGEPGPQATLDLAAKLAVSNVVGCDAAAISLVQRHADLRVAAYTEDLALTGDSLQHELGEGPCVSAAWEEPLVHAPDLAQDLRWPAWSSRVVHDLGARSMLCLQLFTDADTLGALNLYSRRVGAFDQADREESIALAGHIAVALASSHRSDQLTQALDTRTLIGQATGRLMERYGLDPSAAFNLLARLSSQTNTKLRDLAVELVETGHLDDLP